MKKTSICAVVTVHNRREMTLAALEAFFSQGEDFSLNCILMDDGSSDGTEQAVQKAFPAVKVLRGDGSLYWNRGMMTAFAHAKQEEFDYFLWLNNDTLLSPDALQLLVQASRVATTALSAAVVVGSTKDARTGKLSYGGRRRTSWWHGGKFAPVAPTSEVQKCDTMNGNIVLIPRQAAELVGEIDGRFSHSMGDSDYGLRLKTQRIPLVVAPGFQGECERNLRRDEWRDAPTIWKRLTLVNHPKGLPLKEWAYFLRKHGGPLWPLAWISTYRCLLTGRRS